MPTPPMAAAATGKPVAAALLSDCEALPLADPEAAEAEPEAAEVALAEPESLPEPAVAEEAAPEMLSRILLARAVPLLRAPEREDAAAPEQSLISVCCLRFDSRRDRPTSSSLQDAGDGLGALGLNRQDARLSGSDDGAECSLRRGRARQRRRVDGSLACSLTAERLRAALGRDGVLRAREGSGLSAAGGRGHRGGHVGGVLLRLRGDEGAEAGDQEGGCAHGDRRM